MFITRLQIPTALGSLPTAITSMPNNILEFQIANFLTENTKPLGLNEIYSSTHSDTECVICYRRYADPPQKYAHPDLPDGEEEYAVQINNRSPCKHTFGRRCLERHIRGGSPWSHTCPLCRTEWFPAPNAGRQEIMGRIETTLNHVAVLEPRDAQSRQALREIEVALERMRDVLRLW
jgi:hypothetical protein